jgi:Fe-S oxidoreductase
LFTRAGVKNYMKFVDEASDLVVSYGGSFSAEHGDGQSKALFLPKMYGAELIRAFQEFKRAWDPGYLMNPGKVIDPYQPDENLRLGPRYRPWQPRTYFQFPKDEGSFSRATLRCVGVGKCRKTENTFMCPSFLVTREEKDTTRGRAHLWFEMFHQGLINSGWRSEAVHDSLELCLGCKGCKQECPVNVDLATYKSEFRAHHYRHRIRPRTFYSMGFIGTWARIGSKTPHLANFFSRMPGLSRVAKGIAGIAPERKIPKFAAQTFLAWYEKNRDTSGNGRPQLVLFPDVFNNYFSPGTLEATYLLLCHWGYDVVVAPTRLLAPRPLIHYGWLRRAKKEIKTTLADLRPFLERQVPVIFCEPSTASVFRDEALDLFPKDDDVKHMKEVSLLLSEFMEKEDVEPPALGGKVIFHAHCHQKSVLHANAAREILKKMGADTEEPQLTCCGMAGSFGFEKEHYDVSMAVAELNLFPAIRRSPRDTPIVADGFSCRTQIEEGTGRKALHMAEFLLMAYEKNGIDLKAGRTAAREVLERVEINV